LEAADTEADAAAAADGGQQQQQQPAGVGGSGSKPLRIDAFAVTNFNRIFL
jgi:hypothetical protein